MEMSEIKWNESGLIPAIAQDSHSKEVLMLAYMNEEALKLTIETKKAHYYSRSRQSLWLKGETSGHFQHIEQIRYDCDKDTILLIVTQIGEACHTGRKSCFYTNIDGDEVNEEGHILDQIYSVIVNRRENPKEGSYTNYLFDKGIDKMLKKVGEESAEVIIAAKNKNAEEITYEIADLMYHLSVMMVKSEVSWNDIFDELKKRR